jgi:hypothetical protein
MVQSSLQKGPGFAKNYVPFFKKQPRNFQNPAPFLQGAVCYAKSTSLMHTKKTGSQWDASGFFIPSN